MKLAPVLAVNKGILAKLTKQIIVGRWKQLTQNSTHEKCKQKNIIECIKCIYIYIQSTSIRLTFYFLQPSSGAATGFWCMEVIAATKTFPPTTPWLSGNKNNFETTAQLPIRLLDPSCLGLDHALLLFFPQLLLATIPVGFPSFHAWFFKGWRVMFKCCFMKSGFGACWVVWMDYNRHSSFTMKRRVYWCLLTL